MSAIQPTEHQIFEIPAWPLGLVKHTLEIGPEGVTFAGSHISAEEYDSITIGVIRQSVNYMRTSTYHSIQIRGGGRKIRINLTDMFYGSSKGKLFDVIYAAIMSGVGRHLIYRILYALKNNQRYSIGDATFTNKGAYLVGKNLFFIRTDPIFVPYERLVSKIYNGEVTLFDRLYKKLACRMQLATTPNACLISPLVDFLAEGRWRLLSDDADRTEL